MFKISTLIGFLCVAVGISFGQSTSYSSLYDNTTFVKNIDLSKAVGSIGGSASVGPSGAATYSIPVQCPVGTGGMTPNISIAYNSQGANGAIGQGWNLSGLSAITRSGKDMYHDGIVSPVSYSNNDAFILDGTRLSVKSGLNGENLTTYRTESESYSVITSYETIGGGPKYFNVVSKDGTIMEYGNSSDSRFMSDDLSKVMIWRLNKIQDINGNYIWFTYDNSDRDSRIIEIKYTGNNDISPVLVPYCKIQFGYTIRDDINKVYDGGSSIQSKYLLNTVICSVDGQMAKGYQLWYGKSATASFLKNIVEYNGDGDNLNDTRFKYGDITTTAVTEVVDNDWSIMSYPTGPPMYGGSKDVCVGDFDADGLSDIVVAERAPHTYSHTGFDIKKRTSGPPIYANAASVAFTARSLAFRSMTGSRKLNNNRWNNSVFSPIDFWGDGKEDFIVSDVENQFDVSYGVTYRKWYWVKTYFSDGTGGVSTPPFTSYPIPTHANINESNHYFYAGDFNGDGRSDYFAILGMRDPSGGISYKMYMTCPGISGFVNNYVGESPEMPGDGDLFQNASAVNIIDFDGDGKNDIMFVMNLKTYIYTFDFSSGVASLTKISEGGYPNKWHDLYLGDFNGDGKTDILTGPIRNVPADDTKNWQIGYSDGKGFVSGSITFDHIMKVSPGFPIMIDSTDRLVIGDFNGDGKSDIYDHYKTSSLNEHHVYYSTGTGFTLQKQNTTLGWRNFAVGDFNGDGKSDILSYEESQKSVFYYFKPFDISHLLEKVTDGFNRTINYRHKSLTQSTSTDNFYIKGSGATYPLNNAQYPIYVVDMMWSPDGVGGHNIDGFMYENLRLHRAGKGLLGFEKLITLSTLTGIRTESIYDLGKDDLGQNFYVPYLKTTKTFLMNTGEQLSQTDNTVNFERIESGFCFVQKNTKSISHDLLKGVNDTTTNTFDTHGNVTQNIRIISGGGVTQKNTTISSYIATGGSLIHNRPSQITTTSQRNSEPIIKNIRYLFYNSKGLLEVYNDRPILGGTNINSVNLQYDKYGNVVSSKKSSYGGGYSHLPETKYGYDDNGRFMMWEENPALDKKEYTTHKFWGKPLSIKDFNGLTTSFTYDSWGKLTSTTIPTSTSTSYTLNYSDGWDMSGTTSLHQLYYTKVEDPSSPDVKTWFDFLGRPIRKDQEAAGGAWTTSLINYNSKGNISSSTNNYLSTESPFITNNTYDEFNRIKTSSNSFGTTAYTYTQGFGIATTSVTLPDLKVKSSVTDATGKTIKTTNGIAGSVHFFYDSRGNEIKTLAGPSDGFSILLVQKEYDELGFIKKMIDKDAGTTLYEHNSFGQLTKQTDAKGKVTTFIYDILGRLTFKKLDDFETTNTYYGKEKGYQLASTIVENTPEGSMVRDEYNYTIVGGLAVHTKITNGLVTEKHFTYDNYGNPLITYYANSTFSTRNHYDVNGFLEKITTNIGGSEKNLYTAEMRNGNGQIKNFKRVDDLAATITYNNGIPVNYTTPDIQDLTMTYNYTNGNLMSRYDGISNTKEDFVYDAIDRLLSAQPEKLGVGGVSYPALTTTYDNTFLSGTTSVGRIATKSDVGEYKYGSFPRNAVRNVTNPTGLISHEDQDIVYNLFHKTKTITEKIGGIDYEESFIYDSGEDRAYSQKRQGLASTDPVIRKRWYMGNMEIDQKLDYSGAVIENRIIHYISSDAGLVGMVVTQGATMEYYGVYTDHLGSIVALTDEAGRVVTRQAFDAWGRPRNPDTWDYTPSIGAGGSPAPPEWLYRGYTGHEMLPEYGLINMNGRMYDPLNGRMLRPDNFVQDPTNTQSYNRYSYCWNNPLKYTDPSGQVVWLLPSFSVNNGGIGISLTGGIGIPGVFSAQATIGHDFGSNNTFGSIGASVGFVNVSVGWGTKTGFTANAGVGFNIGLAGVNTNMTSIGIGWSERGGMYAYAGGFTYTPQGVRFNPGLSYTSAYMRGREHFTINDQLEACNNCEALADKNDIHLKAVSIYGYRDLNYSGPWAFNSPQMDQMGFAIEAMAITHEVGSQNIDVPWARALVGNRGRLYGRAANMLGVAALGQDVIDYKNGNNMSGARLSYHASSFGASYAAASAYGGVPGMLVGMSTYIAEQSYDGLIWYGEELSKGSVNFTNALNGGWIPGR